MSENLVWQIVKKNNSKTLRRTHPVSRKTYEKGSLRGSRTFNDCGLARSKAVDVSINDDGVPVLSLKNPNPKYARNPDKMWVEIKLKGSVRTALERTSSTMDRYAPHLKEIAMRKVSATIRAEQRKNRGVNHSLYLPAVSE